MTLRLDELLRALPYAWCDETRDSYSPYRSPGTDTTAAGQCIVSTLLIQKHLGGDMIRCKIGGDYRGDIHYFNELPGGMWVDSTRSQFLIRSPMTTIKKNPPRKLWEFRDTWDRVNLLEHRVHDALAWMVRRNDLEV